MIDYLREESEVAKEKDGTSISITQLLERFYSQVQHTVRKFINFQVANKKALFIKIVSP